MIQNVLGTTLNFLLVEIPTGKKRRRTHSIAFLSATHNSAESQLLIFVMTSHRISRSCCHVIFFFFLSSEVQSITMPVKVKIFARPMQEEGAFAPLWERTHFFAILCKLISARIPVECCHISESSTRVLGAQKLPAFTSLKSTEIAPQLRPAMSCSQIEPTFRQDIFRCPRSAGMPSQVQHCLSNSQTWSSRRVLNIRPSHPDNVPPFGGRTRIPFFQFLSSQHFPGVTFLYDGTNTQTWQFPAFWGSMRCRFYAVTPRYTSVTARYAHNFSSFMTWVGAVARLIRVIWHHWHCQSPAELLCHYGLFLSQ